MKADQVKIGAKVRRGTAHGVIMEVSKVPPFRVGVDFAGHFCFVNRQDLELIDEERLMQPSTQDPSSNNYRRWGYGP